MTADYDAIADIYDIRARANPAATPCHDFYVDFCSSIGGPVVELGVGTGRIAVDIARRGVQVVGVDISPKMLELCRLRMACENVQENIELLQADVREFELGRQVPCVIFPFRTIGHLLQRSDRLKLFRSVHSHLVPGGHFVFDHYVFDEHWARAHDSLPNLISISPIVENGGSLYIWDTYVYDLENGVLRCSVTSERTSSSGEVIFRRHHDAFTFSWVPPEEVPELASETGFQVEAVYGSFGRAPYTQSSADQVWVLRKNE
jgi:SAM-dependent methyltransferase